LKTNVTNPAGKCPQSSDFLRNTQDLKNLPYEEDCTNFCVLPENLRKVLKNGIEKLLLQNYEKH
jgi:hypothetical protein